MSHIRKLIIVLFFFWGCSNDSQVESHNMRTSASDDPSQKQLSLGDDYNPSFQTLRNHAATGNTTRSDLLTGATAVRAAPKKWCCMYSRPNLRRQQSMLLVPRWLEDPLAEDGEPPFSVTDRLECKKIDPATEQCATTLFTSLRASGKTTAVFADRQRPQHIGCQLRQGVRFIHPPRGSGQKGQYIYTWMLARGGSTCPEGYSCDTPSDATRIQIDHRYRGFIDHNDPITSQTRPITSATHWVGCKEDNASRLRQ